jgi:hypothetical protein
MDSYRSKQPTLLHILQQRNIQIPICVLCTVFTRKRILVLPFHKYTYELVNLVVADSALFIYWEVFTQFYCPCLFCQITFVIVSPELWSHLDPFLVRWKLLHLRRFSCVLVLWFELKRFPWFTQDSKIEVYCRPVPVLRNLKTIVPAKATSVPNFCCCSEVNRHSVTHAVILDIAECETHIEEKHMNRQFFTGLLWKTIGSADTS